MDSDGEDLENIFEGNENDREADNADDVQDTNETSGVKVPVPKRIVRNPRLKFNPERLCGERGIPILVDHFKKVKFKGVGHEKEDLDKLLTNLEHWTHRLFPSMKFSDCLQHIEKLGKKRPVQTCLRKIRLDMPILSRDFVKENEEDDDVQRVEDSELIEVDAFDRLIEESQNPTDSSVSATENVDSDVINSSPPIPSFYGTGHILGSTSGLSLTEEQKERMERNRLLATERRKAKLAALKQNSSDTQSANEEITPSQGVFNTLEESLNSSPNNQKTVLTVADDLFSKLTCNSKLIKEGGLELNNQNSEDLGLDDLIDLVDEEEPVSGKNCISLPSSENENVCSNTGKLHEFSEDNISKVDCSSFEDSLNASESDYTNSKTSVPDKISNIENEVNLEIESLLDLVNEDSENVQPISVPSCSGMDTSMSDTENEHLAINSKVMNSDINMEVE